MAKILTLRQSARKLQLCERTLRDLCRKGKIPGARKVGHSWRFREDRLLEVFDGGGASGVAGESGPEAA